MHNFAYLRPKSIDEAISLMESYGEGARYIADDRDILVKNKEKKFSPDFLISLRHTPSWRTYATKRLREFFESGA